MSLDQSRKQGHVSQIVRFLARGVSKSGGRYDCLNSPSCIDDNGMIVQPAIIVRVGNPTGFENSGLWQIMIPWLGSGIFMLDEGWCEGGLNFACWSPESFGGSGGF
jgi:hypothetical protein|tara:strand:+ start:1443 stop:1760 length:318 start_codon:yes stop_codon:yes gene_type:complete